MTVSRRSGEGRASNRDAPGMSEPAADATPRREFSPRYRAYVLFMLMGVNLFNFGDRAILGVLIQPIKEELGASDTQMGILTGLAFAVFYAVCGFPIARLADRGLRVRVIAWAMAICSFAHGSSPCRSAISRAAPWRSIARS